MIISLNLINIGIGLIILVGLGIPFLIILGAAIGAGFGIKKGRKRANYKRYEKTEGRELEKDVIRSDSDQFAERMKNLNRSEAIIEDDNNDVAENINIDDLSRQLNEKKRYISPKLDVSNQLALPVVDNHEIEPIIIEMEKPTEEKVSEDINPIENPNDDQIEHPINFQIVREAVPELNEVNRSNTQILDDMSDMDLDEFTR